MDGEWKWDGGVYLSEIRIHGWDVAIDKGYEFDLDLSKACRYPCPVGKKCVSILDIIHEFCLAFSYKINSVFLNPNTYTLHWPFFFSMDGEGCQIQLTEII